MKYLLFLSCFITCLAGHAQDIVYTANIKTPQLFTFGNQLGYPAIRLNSADQVELHFDDMDADIKNYSYTYQLCNADWTPAILSEFDFIRGFSQVHITDYRTSSVALTRYTHYQAILPDKNCVPIRSGNYVVKVFLNGDTAQLAFTRRLLVVDNSANIAAQILQPFNPDISRTYQKIQLNVNTRSLNVSNAFQQVKVWILQNNRWDNAIHDIQPSFYSGNVLQYNSDDAFVFPAGSEWRWLDLQGNLHFQSDRVSKGIYGNASTTLILKPDGDRSQNPYYNYRDYNGMYYIQTTESIDPYWQSDYATVQFTYVPHDHLAFAGKDLYLVGAITDYQLTDSFMMKYDTPSGTYQSSLLLKQGYYNFGYATVGHNDPAHRASFEFTEGNHVETENEYTILVYYRQLGGRADELVGMSRINSLIGR
jgi:hypothetical protein